MPLSAAKNHWKDFSCYPSCALRISLQHKYMQNSILLFSIPFLPSFAIYFLNETNVYFVYFSLFFSVSFWQSVSLWLSFAFLSVFLSLFYTLSFPFCLFLSSCLSSSFFYFHSLIVFYYIILSLLLLSFLCMHACAKITQEKQFKVLIPCAKITPSKAIKKF